METPSADIDLNRNFTNLCIEKVNLDFQIDMLINRRNEVVAEISLIRNMTLQEQQRQAQEIQKNKITSIKEK